MNNDSNTDIPIETGFLGKDGKMAYNRKLRTLDVTMHGMVFNASNMSGMALATKIKEAINKASTVYIISWEMINEVNFYCCYGGVGGNVSVAGVLASNLKKTVRAYTSRYCPEGTAGYYSNKSKLFTPRRKNLLIQGVHQMLFLTSEHIILPASRAFR